VEKENKVISLDQRIAKVREVVERSNCSIFSYKFMASPYSKEGYRYFELSQEEVDGVIPQFAKVFNRDIEVSSFNILCVSRDSGFRFGIESGEGYVNGEGCRFKYLIAQNGEFSGIHMCCKNDQGKGMDHEVYPLFSVSSMPDESQRLISSILDIIEDRLM